MAHDWIDEGLRHEKEWTEQQRLALDRRHQQTAVIKEKAPVLMRDLVAQVSAAIDEYRRKSGIDNKALEFEILPHEGFFVDKKTLPRIALECRPDYEAHVLQCNMTRMDDDRESDPEERLFNLDFTVDESNTVWLKHGARTFQTVDEAVETILKTVLFPLWVSSLWLARR